MTESGAEYTDWMKDARFGLFIHWGLYSVPARQVGKNSLAEWIKSREQLSDEQYDAYFAHFDPDLYDPAVWARAPCRYAVLRCHHETPRGFLPLGLAVHRLQGHQYSRPPGFVVADGRSIPSRRAPGRSLPLAHRLAHPEFPVDGIPPA